MDTGNDLNFFIDKILLNLLSECKTFSINLKISLVIFLFSICCLGNQASSLESSEFPDPYWGSIQLRADLFYMRNQEIQNGQNISDLNKTLLSKLETENANQNPHIQGESLTYEQARVFFQKILKNPVTGNNSKYDPNNVQGFCFGRALYTHLEMLRNGISKKSIKKVYIVGPVKFGSNHWQFHVATMVKAADRETWYVIDNFVGGVLTVDEWYRFYLKYSEDSNLRLFVTDSRKLGANSWEYNIKPGGLRDPVYNGYFIDLFNFFKTDPISEKDKMFPNQIKNLSCSKLFG